MEKLIMNIPKSFTSMLEAWNETDTGQIRNHVDKALAKNIVFTDPKNHTIGKEAFAQMVKNFRLDNPAAVCRITSGIDTHHNLYRYEWAIFVSEELIVEGFDVARINSEKLICRVDGFFGPLPPKQA